MTKPIRPEEVSEPKSEIPPELFEAINELIRLRYREGKAAISIKDISSHLSHLTPTTRDKCMSMLGCARRVYYEAGWDVAFIGSDNDPSILVFTKAPRGIVGR